MYPFTDRKLGESVWGENLGSQISVSAIRLNLRETLWVCTSCGRPRIPARPVWCCPSMGFCLIHVRWSPIPRPTSYLGFRSFPRGISFTKALRSSPKKKSWPLSNFNFYTKFLPTRQKTPGHRLLMYHSVYSNHLKRNRKWIQMVKLLLTFKYSSGGRSF